MYELTPLGNKTEKQQNTRTAAGAVSFAQLSQDQRLTSVQEEDGVLGRRKEEVRKGFRWRQPPSALSPHMRWCEAAGLTLSPPPSVRKEPDPFSGTSAGGKSARTFSPVSAAGRQQMSPLTQPPGQTLQRASSRPPMVEHLKCP